MNKVAFILFHACAAYADECAAYAVGYAAYAESCAAYVRQCKNKAISASN